MLWRRARVVVPLVALAAASVPFARSGGPEHAVGPLSVSEAGVGVFAAAVAKAVVGTLSAVLLAATTTVAAALEALRRLRAPAVLVAIAGVTWRYLFVLAAEMGRMRTALAARGHRPRHLLQTGTTGRLATALFLRSHARGERVAVAMAARGWTGAPAAAAHAALRRADVAFVAALAGLPLALRVAAGGRAVTCAVHARGLTFGYRDGAPCSPASTSASSTASASRCSGRTGPARRR